MRPRDELYLAVWQAGRRAGVPPEKRLPPVNDNISNEDFEQALAVIRKCMERKS